MKKLIGVLMLFMGICSAAYAQIPGISIENTKGETINTIKLIDNKTPMIVSFWSIACKPCIMELNAINDVMEEWHKEADFKAIAISIDDTHSTAKARSFVAGNVWNNFIVLFDKNQDFMHALDISQTPHTLIFDANGKIVYSHVGYAPGSEAVLLEKIKKLE